MNLVTLSSFSCSILLTPLLLLCVFSHTDYHLCHLHGREVNWAAVNKQSRAVRFNITPWYRTLQPWRRPHCYPEREATERKPEPPQAQSTTEDPAIWGKDPKQELLIDCYVNMSPIRELPTTTTRRQGEGQIEKWLWAKCKKWTVQYTDQYTTKKCEINLLRIMWRDDCLLLK